MKTKLTSMSLQQARKNAGLPLSTMADILITDTSNLSKYERGIRKPSDDIVLSYHLLTGASLENLFSGRLTRCLHFLNHQLTQSIEDLKKGIRTMKTDTLTAHLSRCMERLNCLSDVNEKNDEA
ncbi:MAG: transcriptional regulator with XRE-family HTH domain [Crocinitomicaceae bacterium]|jgi:transcriptional regulator with XRE-family HTH domain